MRAMIFGDVASGKSTFADGLGEITGVPVVHLDRIMDDIGRHDKLSIGDVIREEASNDEWIIDGNAFTKDVNYRIERATTVFAFDFNPLLAMSNHIARYARIKAGVENRVGSDSTDLNLPYYVPYILYCFPPRKEAAMSYAHSLDKDMIIFNRKKQAAQYLANLPGAGH